MFTGRNVLIGPRSAGHIFLACSIQGDIDVTTVVVYIAYYDGAVGNIGIIASRYQHRDRHQQEPENKLFFHSHNLH